MKLPPRAAESVLTFVLGNEPSTRFIIGDMREEYARTCSERSSSYAGVWYVLHALRIALRVRWERTRDARGSTSQRNLPAGDLMTTELRQALRFLIRHPAFSGAIVLTVAIAISATTLTFAVVNGVLLEPLPYAHPERLVAVWENSITHSNPRNTVSSANFLTWKDELRSFDALSILYETSSTVLSGGEPERIGVVVSSAAYFDIVGAQPLLGRFYTEAEDVQGAPGTAVLAEGYWHRRFAGDAAIIGKTITLSGSERTVIGVLPARYDFDITTASFAGIGTREVWVPARFGPAHREAIGRNFQVVARLAPGVTPERAQTEASALAAQLVERVPGRQAGWDITVTPLQQDLVGDARRTLLIAFGAVCFFLLIACANVANLLMTRATERQQEIAVRSALGAARGRLIRQLLTESMLLSTIGAACGVVLAWWGLRALTASTADIPRLDAIQIDATVMGFALLVTLATALLFGLLPALHIASGNIGGMLRERGTAGRRGAQRVRGALVIAQMALSLVLLIGAGLMVRSLINRLNVGVGFDVAGLLTAEVQLPGDVYNSQERQAQLFEQLVERVAAIPGVEHASAVIFPPLAGPGTATAIWPTDRPTPEAGQAPSADIRWIHRDYPRTMGIPLLAGRAFTEADRAGTPYVVLINETTARTFWPNDNPIGKRVAMPWSETMTAEVIGVLADVRHAGPDEPTEPMFYWEHRQFRPFPQMTLMVRTAARADEVVPAMRAALRALDANVPLYNVRSMDELFTRIVARPRFTTMSLGAFALLALMLAAIGTYAVMAYTTEQRAQEIGIRMALGANRGSVVRLVVMHGMALIGIALIIGTAGAFMLSRWMDKLVYDITTTDPLTFVAMAGLLAVAGVIACWLPAQRASGIDPVSAIRRE